METAQENQGPPTTTEQWLQATPSLRGELNIDLRKQGGRLVATIEDPVRSRFFQVGHLEYHFLMMLDGKRSVNGIVKAMQHGRGYDNFDVPAAIKICNWLSSMNLMDTPGASSTGRLCQAAQAREKQKLIGILNPVSFKIHLLNPDQTLERMLPCTRWLFTPFMLIAWILIGIFACSLVQSDYERFCHSAVGILAKDRWLWLMIVWISLKIIHEFAHGIACKKFGGDVPQAGLLVLLLAPLAFVNVTSSWRFSSRRKRMIVSAAGMYVELLVAFLAIVVWYYTKSPWLSDLCYNVVVMAGISTVLFNANPLLRFDGYYLLADLLGIVNLYGKGQTWFNDRIRNFMFGFPLNPDVCPKQELRLVAAYGLCSFAWRVVLSISLLLVASTLLSGAGLVLAAIGGVFWVWMPISRNIQQIRATASETPIDRKRLGLFLTGCSLLVFIGFFGMQAPAVSRAPAIVQFKDERVLRAASDGFVRAIHVRDGQAVAAGQLLVRIENPELVQELDALQQGLESARIQARIHRQRSELSLQQAEQAKAESLQQQIEEMEIQVDALNLVAPFDGVVFQRDLFNMRGKFVKQGDVILHFADPNAKQILTSIDQEQIKAVKSQMDRAVRFTFPGVRTINASLTSIDPRATDVPIDTALTAAAGGPLAVQQASADDSAGGSDDDYRLVHPRFTGKSRLNTDLSGQLIAGQRGTAFLCGRNVSVGGYFVLKCKEWIRGKLKSATQGGF